MTVARAILPEFRDHAEAIGYACIFWAHLELTIDGWITTLAPLAESPRNDIITSEIDFRAKLRIIKNLAYMQSPSPEWFEEVKKQLDEIDNKLRNDRNRMIHDLWLAKGHKDSPGRMTRAVKLANEPSTGTPTLKYNPVAPVSSDDVWGLVNAIILANVMLTELKNEWHRARKSPSGGKSPPQSRGPSK